MGSYASSKPYPVATTVTSELQRRKWTPGKKEGKNRLHLGEMVNEGPAAAQQPVAPRGTVPVPHVSPYLQNVGGQRWGHLDLPLALRRLHPVCGKEPGTQFTTPGYRQPRPSHQSLGVGGSFHSFSTISEFSKYNEPVNPTTCQRWKTMVQEHFRTTPLVFKTRFYFVSRTQEPGESIVEYLVALRALLPDCAFGRIPAADFEEEQLKAQLICHTSVSRVRLEIFARRDAMPLRDVVNFLTASETAARDSKGLRHTPAPSMSTLRTRGMGARRGQQQQPSHWTSNATCSSCGWRGHSSTYPQCPVRNKECSPCGREGYFQPVYRSRGKGEVRNGNVGVAKSEEEPQQQHPIQHPTS